MLRPGTLREVWALVTFLCLDNTTWFFFFQAEDGIRDLTVTGVQTCALPISEFVRWQYATWELCDRLGIDAFDQPDVEEAKRLARAELAAGPGGAQPAASLSTMSPDALRRAARPGDYLAILAYLPPRPDVTARLEQLRAIWGRALGCVTTLGFGPRYLHSTGQLHKGGPNTGLFLVLTADDAADAAVPEQQTGVGPALVQL